MLKFKASFLTRETLTKGITLLAVLTTLSGCNLANSTESNFQNKVAQSGLNQSKQTKSEEESEWQEIGELPLPLESHKMIALGEFAYVLGGWNDQKGPYSDVFFTALNSPKTLNNWKPTQVKMPLRLQHHAVITHNKAIYVLGGDNGFGENLPVSDRILRAVPNDQGDITEWVDVGKLPQPLTIHAVSLVDDRLYVFGGSSTFAPNSKILNTVYTATISSTGNISSWQEFDPLKTPIGWQTTTAIGRHIFAVSGKSQFSPSKLTNTISRSSTLIEGSLSNFRPIGKTTPRERHATVKIDQTLVVIGGGGEKAVLTDVEAIAIDQKGNLIEQKALSPLPEPRYAHAAFFHDDYIYVSGGFKSYGSNETSQKIFRLPFNSSLLDN